MNGAVGPSISQKTGHADSLGIVVLQPLLAAKRIPYGRFQLARQFQNLVAGIPAASPPTIATRTSRSQSSPPSSRCPHPQDEAPV